MRISPIPFLVFLAASFCSGCEGAEDPANPAPTEPSASSTEGPSLLTEAGPGPEASAFVEGRKQFSSKGMKALSIHTTMSIHEKLEEIRVRRKLPALGVGYAREGITTLFVAGYRKMGDPTLALWTDKFHLGSLTKAMTATLVAIEVDHGRFTWSSTMEKLLPELAASMHPEMKKLTLEQLLVHRSGVGVLDDSFWSEVWDPKVSAVEGRKKLAARALSSAPLFSPGAKFQYDNSNYIIAGAILDRATGIPWETLMRINLFKPLNMAGCGFGQAGDKDAPHPTQPWSHMTQKDGTLEPHFGVHLLAGSPAGNVHCPMSSYLNFLQFHLDGHNGRPTKVQLKRENFSMLHRAYGDASIGYTAGGWGKHWFDWFGQAYGHGGSDTVNTADTWFAPSKNVAFIGVSNSAAPDTSKAITEAIEIVVREALTDIVPRTK